MLIEEIAHIILTRSQMPDHLANLIRDLRSEVIKLRGKTVNKIKNA